MHERDFNMFQKATIQLLYFLFVKTKKRYHLTYVFRTCIKKSTKTIRDNNNKSAHYILIISLFHLGSGTFTYYIYYLFCHCYYQAPLKKFN